MGNTAVTMPSSAGLCCDRRDSGKMGPVSIWEEDTDEGRAPICPYCGVTALPAELSYVLDTDFICDNADCDAYGERIDP